MCMSHTMNCRCGRRRAEFSFRDEVLPQAVIRELGCPECSGDLAFDPATMLADNGWTIHFDMEVAELHAVKLPRPSGGLSPEWLFDQGYATWQGVYPGDGQESVAEREELTRLAKVNPREYFVRHRDWANGRMERLREAGWRKAREG
jgi:hypothetical protein